MGSDSWLTNPSFSAYASTDLSRPPLAHPVHYPVAEHLLSLKRSEVLPFNGDAKGVHNLCMDVVWMLQSLHGLFDVMLILEYRCSFLRCSGTCIRLRETLRALIGVLSLRVRRECRARNGVTKGRPSTSIPSRPGPLVSTDVRFWYPDLRSLLIGTTIGVGQAWAWSDVSCTLHVPVHRQQ